MKKIVILALCLFGMVNVASARIVDISKSGGLFGHYGTINQVYMGNLNGEQWWTLTCTGWGTNKCKLSPTAGKTVRQSEIEDVENTLLHNLMNSIESEEIVNGNATGEKVKHYQSTLSDNSVVDIYINISWRPNPNDSSKILFHAKVNNSEE